LQAQLAAERAAQRKAERERAAGAEAAHAATLQAARASLDAGQQHALLAKDLLREMSTAGSGGGGGAEGAFADFDAFVAARGDDDDGGHGAAGGSSSSSSSSSSSGGSGSPSASGGGVAAVGADSGAIESDRRAAVDADEPPEATVHSPRYAPTTAIRPLSADDDDRTPPPPDGAAPPAPAALATAPLKPRKSRGSRAVDAAAGGGDNAALFANVDDMAPLVLPSGNGAPGGGAPGVRVWTGYLEMPQIAAWKAEIVSLQVRPGPMV
jgi:hypothetical protein